MVAAFDLRALGTASHIGREVSVEESFADTFDQAITQGEEVESFDSWCERNGAQVENLHNEGDIMIGLLAFCPFTSHPDYQAEARQEILAYLEARG